jgi:hypothetical protein
MVRVNEGSAKTALGISIKKDKAAEKNRMFAFDSRNLYSF